MGVSVSYSAAALNYLVAGWTGVLPVPVDTKFPPPGGFTGTDGADTSPEQVSQWCFSHGEKSIALRMPVGVIGIDVDHYDKPKTLPDGSTVIISKRGADTLAEYEQKWGPLPVTWRSSGRGEDNPSGIRFFQVPNGLKLATVLGDAIEIIQRHHRYAVVAPSAHSSGGRYEWFHPENYLTPEFPVPAVAELPMLPERWIVGLSEHVNQSRTAPAAEGKAAELLAAIASDDRPICPTMDVAANRAVGMLRAAGAGSRHDAAMARTMRIVGLAAEGHTGGQAVLLRLGELWASLTEGEHREFEFDSLVHGAAAQAAGMLRDRGLDQRPDLDPCEGAAGTGIEVMKDCAVRHQVVIVDGLDDARVCAEYAGEHVAVIGLAGHESWRRDGVPVPELRIVAEADTVVMPNPLVSKDLGIWTATTALGEAAENKAATSVGYTTLGARLAGYLATLEENEKAPELARIIDPNRVARRPSTKPRGRAGVIGDDPSGELPPTHDTYLGTLWANDRTTQFRFLTDSGSWLRYRDGHWEQVAQQVVGDSVMRFMHEFTEPFHAAMMQAKATDQDIFRELRNAIHALLSSGKRSAVRTTASEYSDMQVQQRELDQYPTLWCAANCMIDLESGRVYDHDPSLLLTGGSEVAYDPDATCPRFDAFLEQVQPDPDTRDYLMQVFALSMFGHVRDHVLPVLIGEGRNGKGTAIRIAHRVFGTYAHVINPKILLKRKFDQHEVEIAQLVGKRLVTGEETGQGAAWDVARVNEWTGGNDLSGRYMHGNPFTFSPSHTLLLATNHRPSVGDGERAFWARYREIPFNVSVEGHEDVTLEPHIIAHELPGVLNRMLEAGARYRAAGRLVAPAAVEVAIAEAKVESDHLSRYVLEHIAVTHDHELDRIANTELFQSYTKWLSQSVQGEVPPSDRAFPKLMRQALGFNANADNPRKLRHGDSVVRMWTGVRWLNGGHPEAGVQPFPTSATANPIIVNKVDLNPMDSGSPVRDPHGHVADTLDHVADNVADNVDHGSSASAGQGSTVAYVDDIDDKEVIKTVRQPEQTKSDQQGDITQDDLYTNTHTAQSAPIKGQDRQHPDIGNIAGSPSGVVVFDLETDDSDRQHDHPDPRKFFMIGGFSTPTGTVVVDHPEPVIERVLSSQCVVGSNIVSFDLPVLGRIDPRVDVLALAREQRIFDLTLVDQVLNPVVNDKRAGSVGRLMKYFALEQQCARFGVPGKNNSAKELAKKHGGFDAIPLDDPEFRSYCAQDVNATQGLGAKLMEQFIGESPWRQNYLWREHRVHAIASVMGSEGLHVDHPLLQRRYWVTADRKYRQTLELIAKHEIPTTKADGKKAESPARTNDGKAALVRAFLSLGVADSDLPRTGKGAYAFGREVMDELAEDYADHPNAEEIGDLAQLVTDINGSRTIYSTALEALRDDGRVHPRVVTLQASGRWSVSSPGLTVFGKRGGKVIERQVFDTADDSTVLFPIDLSQVDARCVAVWSQDHAYMDIFGYDADGRPRDSHEEVAEMVWGTRDKEHRAMAKIIGHGWNYGMGVPKLATQPGVSLATAQHFNDTMERQFSRLVAWKDEVREIAKQQGSRIDNGFGRIMRPDPKRAYTQGPALFGQGAARDVMMQCLLNIDDVDPRVTRMLRAQVHDEAVFEIPLADAREVIRLIVSCFNFDWAPPGANRPIRIMADPGKLAYNWAGCY
jgi:P4 family phage/plasmid primase-like protien